MFDVGFSELVIISLIALIVIGPNRLPRVARTLGHLAGRLQRYVADVKADINREVELEELRKMRENVEQAATTFESSVQSELNKAESDLNTAASLAANPAVSSVAAPATEAVPDPAERPASAPGATEPPKFGSGRQVT